MSIIPQKNISTNRPTKGIIDINQKLKKLLKVIIYEKERIIPFKVNAKKNCGLSCPTISNKVFIYESNYYLKFLITVLIIWN